MLHYAWIYLQAPAPTGTKARFTSHAPDWVSVPAEIDVPEGATYFSFPVIGVETTSMLMPIAIDVDVDGYQSISDAYSVHVFEPAVRLHFHQPAQAVDSPSNSVRPVWEIHYPCNLEPDGEDECVEEQWSAADSIVQLSIVDAGSPPVVQGLYDSGSGSWLPGVQFGGSGNSDPVLIGEPSGVGSYRVRVTFPDSTFIDSEPVFVEVPSLHLYRSSIELGSGLKAVNALYVEQVVRGQLVASRHDKSIQAICDDVTICTGDTVIFEAGVRWTQVGISGLSAGQTSVRIQSSSALPSGVADVSVVEPSLRFVLLPSSIQLGSVRAIRVSIGLPDSQSLFVSTIPRTVSIESMIPRVLGMSPSVVQIDTDSNVSGEIVVTGSQQGTSVLVASSPNTRPGISALITVNPN